jgi:sulfotransferase
MKKFTYISGLPRAGSTLLVNILAQNPGVAVPRSTSGLHDVMFGIRNNWEGLIEHAAEAGGPDREKLRRVLAAVMDAYCEPGGADTVVDKGRGWLSLLEMAEFATGERPKVVVPVRGVEEVLASFETLHRAHAGSIRPALESVDYFEAQTVAGRCRIKMRADQVVGLAYSRIRDAVARGWLDSMLFLEFDDLASDPAGAMKRVYEFLGLPDYGEHDFGNVEQVTSERDAEVHGIPGLHDIRPAVAPVKHRAEEILGPELAREYAGANFWRAPEFKGGKQS